jgi:hypothetical protein
MEILIGTNPPVKHKVFWGGELVDSDQTPVVKVYDVTEDPAISPPINPGTILTVLSSTKSETDPGTYYVLIPLQYTDRQRKLSLVWEYTVYNNLISKRHDLYVSTPYTDIAQALDVINYSVDSSDPGYKSFFELVEAEKWARKIINAYTGQQFYLYDDLHIIYGDNSDSLRLPYKFSELHELYANDVLLLDNINDINNLSYDVQISESGFGIRVNRSNLLDNTVYTANGMVPPSINDSFGGAFQKNVAYKVQGKYGWDSVPSDIDMACIELMKDYFSKDKSWRNKYIKNVQTFDWKFEYNASTYNGTGNLYVDQILLPYVITQMVVI